MIEILSDIVCKTECGVIYITKQKKGAVYTFEGLGVDIWMLINNNKSREDIYTQLTNTYNITDKRQIIDDVNEFIDDLITEEIIKENIS